MGRGYMPAGNLINHHGEGETRKGAKGSRGGNVEGIEREGRRGGIWRGKGRERGKGGGNEEGKHFFWEAHQP